MAGIQWRLVLGHATLVMAMGCNPLPSTRPLGGQEELPGSDTSSSPEPTPSVSAPAVSDAERAGGEQGDDENEDEGETTPPVTAGKPEVSGETDCEAASETVPKCHELETGPCAEAFGKLCHLATGSLEPGVAAAAIRCLVEKNRESECAALDRCVEPALDRACVRPSDTEWCKEFLKRCPKLEGFEKYHDQRFCERARASLLEPTRERLDECLGEGCELEDCLEKFGTDSPD